MYLSNIYLDSTPENFTVVDTSGSQLQNVIESELQSALHEIRVQQAVENQQATASLVPPSARVQPTSTRRRGRHGDRRRLQHRAARIRPSAGVESTQIGASRGLSTSSSSDARSRNTRRGK